MELNLDLQKQSGKKVILGGVSYEVHALKVKDQLELKSKLVGVDPQASDYSIHVLDAVAKCGVPKDVLLEMTDEQLKAYIEFVGASSEKKQ
jgi:hypothetical protein